MILGITGADTERARQSGRQAAPIWNAIQAAQMEKPAWCVTQVDHARLAGEIAKHLDTEIVPRLDDKLLQAISLHDEGWHELDSKPPVRSFLVVEPADFLRAWRGSIEAARKISEVGALMVSGHFSRLAKARLDLAPNPPKETQLLQEFLREQVELGRKWQQAATFSQEQVEALIDLLQFCDVFSLYLCCGAQERVHFPQKLGGTIFHLYRERDWCVSSPPLFATGVQLQAQASEVNRKNEKGKPTTLAFQIR